jgi:hypothetical protein
MLPSVVHTSCTFRGQLALGSSVPCTRRGPLFYDARITPAPFRDILSTTTPHIYIPPVNIFAFIHQASEDRRPWPTKKYHFYPCHFLSASALGRISVPFLRWESGYHILIVAQEKIKMQLKVCRTPYSALILLSLSSLPLRCSHAPPLLGLPHTPSLLQFKSNVPVATRATPHDIQNFLCIEQPCCFF